MEPSHRMVSPIEADLCRDCSFASFRVLPLGGTAVVLTCCRRLDCDNIETNPLGPPMGAPAVLLGMRPGARRTSILRRAWRCIVDNVRAAW